MEKYGQTWSVQLSISNMGKYGSVWAIMALLCLVMSNCSQLWLIVSKYAKKDQVRFRIDNYLTNMARCINYGHVRTNMTNYRLVWSIVANYGQVWPTMAKYSKYGKYGQV